MIKVLKFGGTCLQNQESIDKVIEIIKKYADDKLLIVTSAMGRYPDPYATDTLKSLVSQVNSDEYSRLLSCGEIISSIILSNELKKQHLKAISVSSRQIELKTHKNKLVNVNQNRIKKYFETYDIIIVPGFQGIDNRGNLKILEKGDSDYTAAYLARRLNLDEVYIFSDVCGIYTGDPKHIYDSKLICHVGYKQALDLAKHKARIICYKALNEGYKKIGFKIKLRSYLNDQIGTLINHDDTSIRTMSIDFDYCLIHFEKTINSNDLKYLNDCYGKNYFVATENLKKLETPFIKIKNYAKVHFVGCGLDKDEIYRNFLDKFAIISQNETSSYYVEEKNWHQDLNLLHDIIVRSD